MEFLLMLQPAAQILQIFVMVTWSISLIGWITACVVQWVKGVDVGTLEAIDGDLDKMADAVVRGQERLDRAREEDCRPAQLHWRYWKLKDLSTLKQAAKQKGALTVQRHRSAAPIGAFKRLLLVSTFALVPVVFLANAWEMFKNYIAYNVITSETADKAIENVNLLLDKVKGMLEQL